MRLLTVTVLVLVSSAGCHMLLPLGAGVSAADDLGVPDTPAAPDVSVPGDGEPDARVPDHGAPPDGPTSADGPTADLPLPPPDQAGPKGDIVVQQELCNNNFDDDGDGLVDCVDPDCANDPLCTGAPCSLQALTCSVGQLCDVHGCTPSMSGVCVVVPATCPSNVDWVCGCDQVSYPNDCLRLQAGVALYSDQSGCK